MTKPWYLSKTIIGGIFLAVAAIVPAIPFVASNPSLADIVQKVLEFIGTLLGIVGVRQAIAANGAGQ